MAIERTGARLTIMEQLSRNPEAENAVGNQLSGGLWEWTQTIYNGVTRVLRPLDDDYRDFGYH